MWSRQKEGGKKPQRRLGLFIQPPSSVDGQGLHPTKLDGGGHQLYTEERRRGLRDCDEADVVGRRVV